MGRAHTQFDLRRGRLAIDIAFPEEVYKIDGYTRDSAFVRRSNQIAQELKDFHKVT